MTPVFISYDKRDKYFVNLLHALLDNEEIDIWRDREKISIGDRYQERIREGLQGARSLIAVVSQHAVESKWVTTELAMFLAARANSPVIPIVLDGTPPAKVYHALEAYQAINMTEDMLVGFVTLCNRFDRKFLSGRVQRRKDQDRRDNTERRRDPLRRLRTGLWHSFARATGCGKFDPVDFSRKTKRVKLAEALEEEMSRYELYDENHRQIDSGWAIERALEMLEFDDKESQSAIVVIESLAAFLDQHYEIKSGDRRSGTERRIDPTEGAPPAQVQDIIAASTSARRRMPR